jgi:hypothetical protein
MLYGSVLQYMLCGSVLQYMLCGSVPLLIYLLICMDTVEVDV